MRTCKLIKINNCQSFKVRFLNLIGLQNHLKNQQVYFDYFSRQIDVVLTEIVLKIRDLLSLDEFLADCEFCCFCLNLATFLAP